MRSVVLNALLAFSQEVQAENAVEALAAHMPPRARIVRDGTNSEIDSRELVRGDVLVVAEGDRISAELASTTAPVEVDLSTLNGESVPVVRSLDLGQGAAPRGKRPRVQRHELRRW